MHAATALHVAKTRFTLSRIARRLIPAALALLLLASGVWAQTNTTDGATPPGIAPGAPAGSYGLSGFENVNLYSGNLNFHLPLVRVSGRGGAQAGSYLSIDSVSWTVNKDTSGGDGTPETPPCGSEELPCLHPPLSGSANNHLTATDPDPNWWQGLKVGYGPGVMHGRRQKFKGSHNNTQNYTFLTRLTFTGSDGTEYELRDVKENGNPRYLLSGQDLSRGYVFVSADGASATFVSDAEVFEKQNNNWIDDQLSLTVPTGYLLLADGTRYRIEQGLVRWLRDRNGNKVTFDYDAFSRVSKVTDSLGREVNYAYDVQEAAPYGLCDRITFSGFGGAPRVIRVSKAGLSAALRPDFTIKKYGGPSGLFPELGGSSATDFTKQVATAVWLPDGVRRYQLFYNSYAELSRVVLPTGGVIEYDYTPGSGVNEQTLEIHRRVTERRVYRDAAALASARPELRQTYQASYPSSSETVVVAEQRSGDGELVERSRHHFRGSAIAYQPPSAFYPPWDSGKEDVTETLDTETPGHASATVLRRTENTWQPGTPLSQWATNPDAVSGPHITQTQTTLGDTGQVSKQTFKYDRYNNQTDVWEYDYGGAHPTRHTHTDYLATNNGVDYTSQAGAHLRGLVAVQRTYAVNPETGAEVIAAKTETRYDEATYPLLSYPGVAVPGWSDPGTTPRGNSTSVRRYIDAASSVAPDQACSAGVCVETHTQYDQFGNVRHLWDARDKLSKVFYGDAFCNDGGVTCGGSFTPNAFAFATRAETPAPGSTAHGATAPLVTTSVYDFYTGKTYSTVDPNNQPTAVSYEDENGNPDPLDRPRSVTRPDGGRTEFEYGDSVGDLYVRVLADLDGMRRIESKEYFDGLGRVYRKASHENSVAAQSWLHADTAYDALGRVVRSSMPYRSAGGGIPLTPAEWSGIKRSETEYDALGRVRKATTRPDGAAVSTAYAGNRVLVTDQAGKQKISETDALGRLKEVWEVAPNDSVKYPGIETIPFPLPGGPAGSAYGYRTSYFYDALGNLRRVKQGSQARFFAYDSLGRLVRAKNPEQDTFAPGGDFPALTDSTSGAGNSEWSLGYVYDANGNLTKRIDARGTVTNYGYDALNRNITVSYTLGATTTITPNVQRFYDNPAQDANGMGRFWKSESLQTAQTAVEKYDPMGRPKEQTQKFWAAADWGQGFTTKLTYNLSGGVTSQTYPSGHQVEYQHDGAGRLGDNGGQPAFRGTLGDGAERTYASQVSYDELGGMREERFGTQTPLYHKRHYNARGQFYDVRLSTVPWATDQWEWNRGAIVNYYDAGCQWKASDAYNNGNVRCSEHAVPLDPNALYTPGAAGIYATSLQSYTYDALNRLEGVSEKQYATGGSLTPAFTQGYKYDRWGNRTIDPNATQIYGQSPVSFIPEPQFSVDPQTNRLGVPAGQSGQMTYDPAGNLTYDSYQGGDGGGGERRYDAENRMTSVQFLAGQTQTASYTYDADGRRVKRNMGAGGEVWQIHGMGGELLAEYTPSAPPSQPLKEYGYRAGELLVTAEAPARYNVALASNGATITAQSYTADGVFAGLHFQPSFVNDGRRYASPQGDRYWRDGHGLASWLQVDFGGTKTIDEVDIYTLADHPAYTTQADPSATQTFTQYGVTAFEVQYWTGSAWATVPGGSVYGNNKVWRKVTFPAVTTSKIRVVMNSATDGVARIVEVEAWGSAGLSQRINAALRSEGGQATASSTTPDTEFPGLTFPVNSINDGDHKGLNWEHGGGWRDGTNNAYPDWVQVEFSGEKTIDEIDVFTVQDAISSPSEPTETMTFTQYGATAYDVEYWTGSSWITVPGGSVTGNDKVWRKFTFSAVVTSRIRIRINNALAGRSRLVEVKAWSIVAASTTADVRWLVSDHLGTPRMVVDQTGSLTGVSRHDYFPFGEEIGAEVGGRTTTQGYSADNVRQKFAGYERDSEVGLDYAQARYYASAQGRFTSGDPLMASGNPSAPQTWNRYSYALNSPMRLIDPTGLITQDSMQYVRENGQPIVTCPGGTCSGELYSQTAVATTDTPIIDEHGIVANELFFGPLPPENLNEFGTSAKGAGVGFTAGTSGGLGMGLAGGGFFDLNLALGQFSDGTFLSNGGAISGGAGGGLPHELLSTTVPAHETAPFVIGSSVGGGIGMFFTNAGNVEQLRGPFSTHQISTPVLGVQYDSDSSGTKVFSITFGPTLGGSYFHGTTTSGTTPAIPTAAPMGGTLIRSPPRR